MFGSPPVHPQNGYISPYDSTTLGATITFLCEKSQCQHSAGQSLNQSLMEAVCNQEGNWEPDPIQVCSSMWKPMSALYYAQLVQLRP